MTRVLTVTHEDGVVELLPLSASQTTVRLPPRLGRAIADGSATAISLPDRRPRRVVRCGVNFYTRIEESHHG